MSRHRHLLLRDLGKASESFEAYGGGNTHRPSPVGDRLRHAGRLRGDLAGLSSSLRDTSTEQRDIASTKRGVTVAVTSRSGEALDVGGSLRADSRGTKLLSVRRGADIRRGRGSDRAVMFLTAKAIDSLNKALDAYEEWVEDEQVPSDGANEWIEEEATRRPRGFWLFESAATFRIATVEDLWTDTLENFPRRRGAVEWEVWVRASMVRSFETAAKELAIGLVGRPTEFADIKVYNAVATHGALRRLVARSAAVIELRGASNFIAEHADLPPPERLRQIAAIAERVVSAPRAAPWVTLLDTGVNPEHPLLAPALPAGRCRTVSSKWDRFDADGHGSRMAGVALYGDLEIAAATTGPLTLEVGLESVVVFDPTSDKRLPARDAIAAGVNSAERSSSHPRVYCLAATAVGEAEDGRPTSTSGAVDRLAFGDGEATRLFCVAVGNVHTSAEEPYETACYGTLNEDHGIQSPAQALNVLSVGALTRKCSSTEPLAEKGDLSPRSRTAQPWNVRRHKPDIVMEGGNHALDPGGTTSRPHGPDMVATTSNNPYRITLTGDTSAAAAAAAGLAGRLMARYPAMRPETVRGLLVHASRWTPAMLERRDAMIAGGKQPIDATLSLLDCFGWGVPDEERLFWSAGNALTLIAEDHIRPYEIKDGKTAITLREMKSFRLPWPDQALSALGSQEVELRCTLSFFVDPDLHSAGLDRLQLYPSHRLQFDFQRFQESEARAIRRVNRAAAAASGHGGEDDRWLLGTRKRARGTLHQDVWRGPAYELVNGRVVNVLPVRGWWGNDRRIGAQDRSVRFSLIVSVRTPETRNDLVVEAMSAVPTGLLVDVPSVVAV